MTFGATLTPSFNAYGAYSTTEVAAEGLTTVGFNASFGKPPATPCTTHVADISSAFFQLWMGVLCFVYMICALRTNIVFVGIFATLVPAFGCLAGAYWHLAQGNAAMATTLQVAAGAFCFVTCMLGWWIFSAILLASLDFPFQLPGELLRGHEARLFTNLP